MSAKGAADPDQDVYRRILVDQKRWRSGQRQVAAVLAEHPRCGGRTNQGRPCRAAAGGGTDHPGFGRCKRHFGSTPAGVRYAARCEAAAMFGVSVEALQRTATRQKHARYRERRRWRRALEADGAGLVSHVNPSNTKYNDPEETR